MKDLLDDLSLDQILRIIHVAASIQLIYLDRIKKADDIYLITISLDEEYNYVTVHVNYTDSLAREWKQLRGNGTLALVQCIGKIYDCNIKTEFCGFNNISYTDASIVFYIDGDRGANGLHKSKESIIFGERNPDQGEEIK